MARDIDIDHLTIDELADLNDRVIERIRYLERIQVFEAMQNLNLGTRVTFDSRRDGRKASVIAKFNQKSVTRCSPTTATATTSPLACCPSKAISTADPAICKGRWSAGQYGLD